MADHICIHCNQFYLLYSGSHSCPYCGKISFKQGDFVQEFSEMAINNMKRWGSYKGPSFYVVTETDRISELFIDLFTLYDEMFCLKPFSRFITGNVNHFLSDRDEIFRKSVIRAAIMIYDRIKKEFYNESDSSEAMVSQK